MKFIASQFVIASAIVVTGLAASAPAFGQTEAGKPVTKEPAQPGNVRAKDKPIDDPYPLATCPISSGKLGSMGDPIIKTYDGREVRFCCDACPPKFEKELAKNLARLDEAIIKDQLPLYPLATSVVSGKKLPEKAIDWVYSAPCRRG